MPDNKCLSLRESRLAIHRVSRSRPLRNPSKHQPHATPAGHRQRSLFAIPLLPKGAATAMASRLHRRNDGSPSIHFPQFRALLREYLAVSHVVV